MATQSLPLLGQARIVSPCPMKWDDLTPTGESAVRHCGACRLNVYNFAELSGPEAEDLIRERARSGERLCGMVWRRADGTITTRNCPVGWRAARQRAFRTASRVAAAIGLFVTGGVILGGQQEDRRPGPARVRAMEPFRTVSEWISPSPPPPVMGKMVLGEICVTPAPAPAPVPAPGSGPGSPTGAGNPDEERR